MRLGARAGARAGVSGGNAGVVAGSSVAVVGSSTIVGVVIFKIIFRIHSVAAGTVPTWFAQIFFGLCTSFI